MSLGVGAGICNAGGFGVCCAAWPKELVENVNSDKHTAAKSANRLAVLLLVLMFHLPYKSAGEENSRLLTAAFGKAEILAEERHYMILEAIGHGAGMSAGIDLKTVRQSVLVE